jgi:hypothetical protein
VIRISSKDEDVEDEHQPKTPEVEERLLPQPSTPKPPEDGKVSSQKIFEDIHEQLVYDSVEKKLSNLIDIEPEGENETKEMSITLQKSMTFKFNVHTATPQAVKEAVDDLVHHFEDTLKYNVETVIKDSEEFPVHLRATKKTKVEVKKVEGTEYDTVNLAKYDEQRKTEGLNRLMCFAIRSRQEEKTVTIDDTRREEKLERRKRKLQEQLEEAKEYLWKIKDDEDFERKSEIFINETISRLEKGFCTEF